MCEPAGTTRSHVLAIRTTESCDCLVRSEDDGVLDGHGQRKGLSARHSGFGRRTADHGEHELPRGVVFPRGLAATLVS